MAVSGVESCTFDADGAADVFCNIVVCLVGAGQRNSVTGAICEKVGGGTDGTVGEKIESGTADRVDNTNSISSVLSSGAGVDQAFS